MSHGECLRSKTEMARMWVHESRRVYRDKLVDEKDIKQYDLIEKDIVQKCYDVSQFYALHDSVKHYFGVTWHFRILIK